MTRRVVSLERVLRDACIEAGAAVFGVASVADIEHLPRIKARWGINRYSRRPTSVMPSARSVIVFGVPSRDDTHELAVRIRGEEYEYPGYVPLSHIRRRVSAVLKERGFRSTFPREVDSFISFKRIAPLAGIGAFGKNSLIINPEHGPWLRFAIVLTDAPLKSDKPFKRDLCGECTRCIQACPVGALKPYKVDDRKCLVGVDPWKDGGPETAERMRQYQPMITKRSYVMCTACQMVCPYTSEERRRSSHMACSVDID